MTRQRVCVLGSTGSIGVNTLDVLSRHPERYEVIALTARQRLDVIISSLRRYQPDLRQVRAVGFCASVVSVLGSWGWPVCWLAPVRGRLRGLSRSRRIFRGGPGR